MSITLSVVLLALLRLQRIQEHGLSLQIEELEKEAAREQSRLRQVEGELRCQKAHVKDMELKQGVWDLQLRDR
eukprot:86055-Pelagomonas_calceolata.AAC.6